MVKPEEILSAPFPVEEFECDIDLPPEGLEPHVKKLLVELVDMVNGPQAITQKSRLLQRWSDKHSDALGVPGSIHCKRVKWLVDQWKKGDFAAIKTNVLNETSTHSMRRLSTQEQQQKRPPVGATTPAKKPQTTTTTNTNTALETQSPPTLKKEATTKKKMAQFGSPLYLFTTASTATKVFLSTICCPIISLLPLCSTKRNICC